MQKSSLTDLAEQHRAIARTAASGRSAQTLHGGHASTLRQTLIALAAGQQLDEHENPGEATLHVLHGAVRMIAGDDDCDAVAGELIVIPDARHSLHAVRDAVVLLSVGKAT